MSDENPYAAVAEVAKRTGGITGHRFQPGQSGNPGGRPKGVAALARQIREVTHNGEEVITFLRNVMNSRDGAVSMADRVRAAELLLRYGFGSPIPMVQMDVLITGAPPIGQLEDARVLEVSYSEER